MKALGVSPRHRIPTTNPRFRTAQGARNGSSGLNRMAESFTPSNIAAALDAIAETFDQSFTNSVAGGAQRRSVWRELDRCFSSGQRILELECGTGVDATHLATRGVEVWACEQSSKMLEVAHRRVVSSRLPAPVSLFPLAPEQISMLQDRGPFDGAFSDFGALNCVEDMAALGRSLASLLKPGAKVVLCMAGTCVAWEVILFLWHGRFRDAFRRLGRGPVHMRLTDDLYVACWYPSVRAVRRAFCPHFGLLRWRGVGVTIPPTYWEKHAKRFPKVMTLLAKLDPWLGRTPLVRALADHLLLTFEKAVF